MDNSSVYFFIDARLLTSVDGALTWDDRREIAEFVEGHNL